mgnify:CR=1 FL=1
MAVRKEGQRESGGGSCGREEEGARVSFSSSSRGWLRSGIDELQPGLPLYAGCTLDAPAQWAKTSEPAG